MRIQTSVRSEPVTMFAMAAQAWNKSVCSVLIYDNSRPSQLNIAFSSRTVDMGALVIVVVGGGVIENTERAAHRTHS